VLNKYIVTGALAAACSGTFLAAQSASPSQQPQTPAQPRSAATQSAPQTTSTTVIGCVYREQDVPGRAPNIAERAGVLEDYILAEVTGEAGSSGAPGAAGRATAGTSGAGATAATGTSGAGRMYKLEFVDDARLKSLVGKRVEVAGKIDAEEGDSKASPSAAAPTSTTDKVIGRDTINLSEFEVSSIKEVTGSCPTLK
jgi:hypothetical protein